MPRIIGTARQLVGTHQVSLSSIPMQGSSFSRPAGFSQAQGGARERRISVSFQAADAPKVIWHGLGFAPTGYQVMGMNRAGRIYNDFPLRSSSRVLVLKCDTANLTADILVR